MTPPPPGLVAVPVAGDLPVPVVRAIFGLRTPPGSAVALFDRWTTPACKRNEAVEALLEDEDLRWLLLMDADVLPPPDGVLRLLDLDAPVAAGLYLQRREPHLPEAGWIEEPGSSADPARRSDSEGFRVRPARPEQLQGPTEVDVVGAGFLLARRRVFDSFGPPWFSANAAWHRNFGRSDDWNFSLACRAAGHRVVLDPSVRCGHLTRRTLRPTGGVEPAAPEPEPSGASP